MNIILVHIGTEFPKYLMDNIFQLLVINILNIYVVISDQLSNELTKELNSFSKDTSNIRIILESDLRTPNDEIDKYMTQLKKEFRDNFWNTTTTRFYYITKCIEKYLPNEKNIVHIETDVLLYYDFIVPKLDQYEIYMVKDHEYRVVPSIIIYRDLEAANRLTTHITEFLFSDIGKGQLEKDLEKEKTKPVWYNDMHILSRYPFIKELPHQLPSSIIFDGASIGQYLCGTDPRNIQTTCPDNVKELVETLTVYNNPKIGFINETFGIMNTAIIKRKGSAYTLSSLSGTTADIINLHIHSKQLWTVNSTNDIKYSDIISGDRILENCDIVFTTPVTEAFHKDLQQYTKVSLCLPLRYKEEHRIQIMNVMKEAHQDKKDEPLKVFVYSNYIQSVVHILKTLDIDMHLYLHNSDDHLDQETYDTLDNISCIKKIYCQNLLLPTNKFNILPIGLANRMYPHGSIIDLCKTIEKTYKQKRTKGLYVQMSNTHPVRTKILNTIISHNNSNGSKFVVQPVLPYKEYLEELAKHYFSLCPRGNGIDTHRFWESLYLGVIPVVICEDSDMPFYNNLRKLVPFYTIPLDQLKPEMFTKELYETFPNIQTLEALKLSNYISMRDREGIKL